MNTSIILEFENIFDRDQEGIKSFREGKISSSDLSRMQNDQFNEVKSLIEVNGFPFINTSSQKAYKAAFLAIQHSGDVEHMREVLNLFMEKDDSQIVRGDIAFLADKIRVLEKKPQLYGTQFRKEDGGVFFFEIEDEKNIDVRRAQLGLSPFKEYKDIVS